MKKLSVVITILLSLSYFAQAQTSGYKPGDKAIDFNLKSTDGSFQSLASLSKGKGFIVIFTCNHCPFSQAYEQRIIALHKKYAPKGMPVVAINPNDPVREPEDSYDNMKKRAKKYKYPFVYLVDENQSIAKAYGAMRTPHVYVLDANRNVIYIGAIDDNFEDAKLVKEKYLENALDAFLSGKPILNPVTKAIGCGIKWKK
jgi:peroxiredoxin